jgi:DNA-binding transcriptional regulator/RsmH inhibitor MraZ
LSQTFPVARQWRIGGGDPVRHVVTTVDPKGRLQIPEDFRPSLGTELLGHLIESGRLRLSSWEPRGPQVDKEYRDIAARAEIHDEDLDRMADLAQAFQRLTLSDGRVGLPRPVQVHLEVRLGLRTSLRARELVVVRFPSWVEVWSRRHAGQRLRRVHVNSADLDE